MASLFLGTVSTKENKYEIHAVTKDLPFREFSASEISDRVLYRELLKGRFKVLAQGKPIYCTAINPDIEQKIEKNPHDSREGTVHIVAIDDNRKIAAALSIAVDIGERDGGKEIGLPLENAWQQNNYPEGASLEAFRQKYMQRMYGEKRHVEPWEMAELYRHYKLVPKGNLLPRLALYAGWYHLGMREAEKKGWTPTWLWVFDAIPSYFNLYKLVAKAVLRDWTIEMPVKLVSPAGKHLHIKQVDGCKEIFYQGRKISRSVKTLIPIIGSTALRYKYEDVPFLDGLVDVKKLSAEVEQGVVLTSFEGREGFCLNDKIKVRIGLGVTAKRAFEQDYHKNNRFSNYINRLSLKRVGAEKWEFNHIGDL
ncbi:MAG: hypothetical protein BZ151_10060 [Desulfobacca sp. 4484_104]|nr:MAG: hypothetical protein BZ151_10060 [Desulfobacca sp. 4484_104]